VQTGNGGRGGKGAVSLQELGPAHRFESKGDEEKANHQCKNLLRVNNRAVIVTGGLLMRITHWQ